MHNLESVGTGMLDTANWADVSGVVHLDVTMNVQEENKKRGSG